VEDQWILENGVLHRYGEDGYLEEEVEFAEMRIDMKEELREFFEKQRSPEEMSSRELRKQIAILRQAGSETQKLEVAYHFKFSLPFSAVVFMLMGMPLGVQKTKDTKALGVIVTVILAFVYYMLLSIFRSLGSGRCSHPLAFSLDAELPLWGPWDCPLRDGGLAMRRFLGVFFLLLFESFSGIRGLGPRPL